MLKMLFNTNVQLVEQKKELEDEASELRIELLQKEKLAAEDLSPESADAAECSADRKSGAQPQVTSEELARLREYEIRVQCPVCMDRPRDCTLRPCGHAFCQQCVDDLLQPLCPLCSKCIISKLPLVIPTRSSLGNHSLRASD